jgi:hypothetical protein
MGGIALGGIAFGGLAAGPIAIGGLAIGLLAFGGLALALLTAVGGGAVAPIAIGGGAAGYLAYGGGSYGTHTYSGLGIDPVAWDFFEPWTGQLLPWFFWGILWSSAFMIVGMVVLQAWVQRRNGHPPTRAAFIGQLAVAFLSAAVCLVPTFFSGRSFRMLSELALVSGTVKDANTGSYIPGARVMLATATTNTLARSRADGSGRYSLVVRNHQVHFVVAEAGGYETKWLPIGDAAFGKKRHARAEFSLQPKGSVLIETWSPGVAAGATVDLNQLLQEASDLAKQGRHEEALQRQIWYFNHALEQGPAHAAVRLSFAVEQWGQLAAQYPPARQAMIEARDRAVAQFAQGEGSFTLFQEVDAFNQRLGEGPATLDLFDSIRKQSSDLAQQCYFVAERALVDKGEYSACAGFIARFDSRFAQAVDAFRRTRELADQTPAGPASLRQDAQRSFVSTTRMLIEILVGVGRQPEAESIQTEALAVLNVPELQSAVTDAAQKVSRRKL